MVRSSGRRSRKVLRVGLQEFEDYDRFALQLRRSGDSRQAAGIGDGRGVRARRTGVHRAQRRSRLQVQRGDLAAGLLRHTERDRRLLGEAVERRRSEGAAVRLAEGQVRPLVAGRSRLTGRDAEGSRIAAGAAGHDGPAPDEEDSTSPSWSARLRARRRTHQRKNSAAVPQCCGSCCGAAIPVAMPTAGRRGWPGAPGSNRQGTQPSAGLLPLPTR